MKTCFKSMKKLLLWFAFGACVCLVLNGQAQPSASPSQPSAQLNSAYPTAPVTVPEPSPKAVSFYHSTMLLIAVVILWSLLIPVGCGTSGVEENVVLRHVARRSATSATSFGNSQPSLRDLICWEPSPGGELPGYFRLSLRDRGARALPLVEHWG